MRINARLDKDRAQKLEYLSRSSQMGTTETLKRAIDLYYERVTTLRHRPIVVFEETGFIGCGQASSELSSSYKEDFEKVLDGKYPE